MEAYCYINGLEMELHIQHMPRRNFLLAPCLAWNFEFLEAHITKRPEVSGAHCAVSIYRIVFIPICFDLFLPGLIQQNLSLIQFCLGLFNFQGRSLRRFFVHSQSFLNFSQFLFCLG